MAPRSSKPGRRKAAPRRRSGGKAEVATRRRYGLWGGGAILLILLFLLLWLWWRGAAETSPDRSLRVAVSSSLPLRYGSADIGAVVQGTGAPSPLWARLDSRYFLSTLDDLTRLPERSVDVMLLIQPRALSPKELVAFDRWLASGGRALILADPALSWQSDWPMDDARRPLFTSMLSPLFSHWGLELTLPITDDPVAEETVTLDGYAIDTATPGRFVPRVARSSKDSRCTIKDDGLRVDCRVGRGRALLVADADLVDPAFWVREGPGAILGDRADNMDWLDAQLRTLARR